MSRYATWAQLVQRYPDAAKVGGGTMDSEAAFIGPAEAQVDGALANRYTVPFCNTISFCPPAIQDLVIDLAYYRAVGLRSKFGKQLAADISSRFALYNGGYGRIMTNSGTIAPTNTSGIFNTAVDDGYAPSFGMDNPIDWAVSSDWQATYANQHGVIDPSQM